MSNNIIRDPTYVTAQLYLSIRLRQINRNYAETGIERDDMGYDENGYDENGRDRYGLDADGYDRNGVWQFDPVAPDYEKLGYFEREWHMQRLRNPDGRDDDGYDDEGYDIDGYDRNGLDKDWYNRQGVHLFDEPRWNVHIASIDPNYTPRPPEDVLRRYLDMINQNQS